MRILHLTLPTAALPALTTFYAERLGLPVESSDGHHTTLLVGASRLTFRATAPVNDHPAPFFHFAFDVPADAVPAAGAWLAPAADLLTVNGSSIIAFPNWQAHSVYFRDPAGNVVECIGRQPVPGAAAGEPFSARDLRGLSEIGLVLPDGAAWATATSAATGIPLFHRQPSTANFVVLGDDNGLLIVVPPGRAWYPTASPSAEFELTVSVEPAPGAAAVLIQLPLPKLPAPDARV